MSHCIPTRHGRLAAVSASVAALSACCALAGAAPPRLLIASQPEAGTRDFVDLVRNLEPALREGGRVTVVVLKADAPEVRAALEAKRITLDDIKAPISEQAARKVADAVGAVWVLRVSSHYRERGLDTVAYLDSRNAGAWNTPLTTRLQPPRTGKRGSIAEGVHGHVEALVKQVHDALRSGGAVAPAGPTGPADSPTGPAPPKPGDAGTPGDPVKPGDAAKPGGAPKPQDPGRPDGAAAPPPGLPFSTYEAQITRARRANDVTALIVALRRAINERPLDAGLRRELIETYRARGWTAPAHDEVTRAAALSPDDAGIRRLVGDDLMVNGDVPGALKEYERAAQLAPADVEVHVALGDAYWNAARPDDSFKAYAAAAQASPGSPLPHRKLARLHLHRGKFAECLAEINAAAKLTPVGDPGTVAECAGILQQVGGSMSDMLARLQAVRKGLGDGTRTREAAFTDTTAVRKQAEETAQFVDALPTGALSRVAALYSQAGSLLVQSAECYLLALEDRDSAREEESSLLRVEAAKQLTEADKRLRAAMAARTDGP